MRDQYFGWRGALGLAEVLFVQALPLPLLVFALLAGAPGWLVAIVLVPVVLRAGVLVGTARAYVHRPWTYWLSPLADLPAALALIGSAVRRSHTWRGRTYERAGGGGFQLVPQTHPSHSIHAPDHAGSGRPLPDDPDVFASRRPI
jgi:dolichol-phosphate mannosyltransferase